MSRREDLRRQSTKRASARSIHDLRVETRRQLALTVLAGEVCGVQTAKIRRSLKRCLRNTAKLRDAQVQLALIDRMAGRAQLRGWRRHWRRLVVRRRKDTENYLERREKKLHRRIERLIVAMVVLPATGRAASEIHRALQGALVEAGKLARKGDQGGEELHQARLGLKRLRYMAEPLCGIVPGITPAWIRQLHRCQRTMGDIHDLELLAARMAKHKSTRPRARRLRMAAVARKQRFFRGYREVLRLTIWRP